MAKSTKQSGAADPAKLERQRLRAERRLVRQREASEKAWGKYQIELREVAEREGERQFQQDGIEWLEGRDTDGARRMAAIIEQKKKAVAASRIVAPLAPAKLPRAVRKAEASAFDRKRVTVKDAVVDVGTGQTIIKMRPRPIPKLVDEGKIGPEELQAAEDILLAFSALTSGLMSRGINYDRVDNGRGMNAAWPVRVAKAVVRYQDFARLWTRRKEDYCDPTLAILIDAVVDQRWVVTIASDHGYRVKRVESAIIGGLRDYAARAGFVTGHKAQAWQDEAGAVFGAAWLAAGAAHQGPAEYRKAVRRAALEK